MPFHLEMLGEVFHDGWGGGGGGVVFFLSPKH